MTQDELKALIEDLRLNHEYCPKEVILQAADELERLAQPEQEPVIDKSAAKRIATVLGWEPKHPWVGLTLTQVKLLGEGVQEEAIKSGHSRDWVFYTHINEALKEKNT